MKDNCKRELNENGELKYVLGFKYTYSTLMSYMKDDLIDLLRIAQDNYENAQSRIFNVTKYAEKLDKALNEACELIYDNLEVCPYDKVDYDFGDCSECDDRYNAPKCWRKYLMKGEKE